MLGLKFGYYEHPAIKFKPYYSFEVTQALVSTDLTQNEGMSKEGQLVVCETHEHVKDQLKEVSLAFTIWFKSSKKEGAESIFLLETLQVFLGKARLILKLSRYSFFYPKKIT